MLERFFSIDYADQRDTDALTDADRSFYDRILAEDIRNPDATSALYQLSSYLYRYYGKKVIILLDEYDTPMQEAYLGRMWTVRKERTGKILVRRIYLW